MRYTVLILCFIFSINVSAQSIPVHNSHTNIYDYLDELSVLGIIEINSTIQPFSRFYILSKLKEAGLHCDQLNKRQNKELNFYLSVFSIDEPGILNPYKEKARLNVFKKSAYFSTGVNPLGLYYKDSVVTVAIKPVWGIRYATNNNGTFQYTWGGALAYLTYGKHWGFYAHLVENNMSEPISLPQYYVQDQGGNFKINSEGMEASTYSEMRGGATYSWKWGNIGMIKDNIVWGEAYNGTNIFSGRTPSFPMIKFNMHPAKWFDFNYVHGWLVSQVIDSIASYITSNGDFRAVYRNKYLAANMYTFRLYRGTQLSFGNSIIYSDVNVQPAYLIPFLFFKSVDHTLNHRIDNQNSQMFGTLSVRLINHLHIYGNAFIDDFSVLRITDKERQNFVGYKTGARISDWPLQNVILTAEYTKTNPVVYKHRVETLSFESNQFNLGHYLRDNSKELFLCITLKPFHKAAINFSYIFAEHGNEYSYTNGLEAEKYPFLEDVTWRKKQLGAEFSFEFLPESYLFLNYNYSEIHGYDVDNFQGQYYLDLFTPTFLQGVTNTFVAGFNFGF